MDATCVEINPIGARTVLHMSPSVMAAAVVSAPRNGLNLRAWLDRAVASFIADDPKLCKAWPRLVADIFTP